MHLPAELAHGCCLRRPADRGARPARETTPRHAHRHRGIGIRSLANGPAFRGIRRFGSPGGSWARTVHWRRTSNPCWTATGQNVAAQAKPAHGRQEQGDRAWFGNRRLRTGLRGAGRDQSLRGGRAVVGGRWSQQERAGRQAELGRAISAQIERAGRGRVKGCRDGRTRRPVRTWRRA